jgi:hypothetical protein
MISRVAAVADRAAILVPPHAADDLATVEHLGAAAVGLEAAHLGAAEDAARPGPPMNGPAQFEADRLRDEGREVPKMQHAEPLQLTRRRATAIPAKG